MRTDEATEVRCLGVPELHLGQFLHRDKQVQRRQHSGITSPRWGGGIKSGRKKTPSASKAQGSGVTVECGMHLEAVIGESACAVIDDVENQLDRERLQRRSLTLL